MNHFDKVITALVENNATKATYFISPKLIARASRKTYLGKSGKRHLPRKTDNLEILLTYGRPNYQEREFIKKCIKAGEPFPVKKIQLKFQK